MGDRRGGKMSLREKNGEEFDQVEVALIPVFEQHVPDEFGVGGHSDHRLPNFMRTCRPTRWLG